jgi:hypothetical protein
MYYGSGHGSASRLHEQNLGRDFFLLRVLSEGYLRVYKARNKGALSLLIDGGRRMAGIN